VRSFVTREFRDCFSRLPETAQRQARKAYRLFRDDPHHPSLRFKRLLDEIWSVRISLEYHAVGRRDGATIVWFWIGSHANYDEILK